MKNIRSRNKAQVLCLVLPVLSLSIAPSFAAERPQPAQPAQVEVAKVLEMPNLKAMDKSKMSEADGEFIWDLVANAARMFGEQWNRSNQEIAAHRAHGHRAWRTVFFWPWHISHRSHR